MDSFFLLNLRKIDFSISRTLQIRKTECIHMHKSGALNMLLNNRNENEIKIKWTKKRELKTTHNWL